MNQRKVEMDVLDEEGIDRISILPEPVAHQILSFLSTNEVAIISALSKKFYSLWSSFPNIVFDQNLFKGYPGTLDLESSEARNSFLDFVARSIQRRQLKTDLEKFSLKCNGEIKPDPRIDLAINFALNNNVKDLRLQFWGYDSRGKGKVKYVLKETFDLKSVTNLKLTRVELNLNWLFTASPLMQCLTLFDCSVLKGSINPSGNDITFTTGQSLRVLSFENVTIPETWCENYICKFPNLEILCINMCNGLKRIQVSNKKLREVEFNCNFDLVSIEIVVPELVSFQHIGCFREPCAINIAACKIIKNLFLKAVHVTDNWFRENLCLFSHLEKLRLEVCVELVRVHIASNHLQALGLFDCENLVEVNIDAPNLNSFDYRGALVFLSLMNSPRLRNPTLSVISNFCRRGHGFVPLPKDYVPPINVWYAGMRDFLARFDHCEAVTLVCNFYQDIIFPKYLRDRELPPLYDIKSLRIKFGSGHYIETELVASLLWISPNVETLCFTSNNVEKIIKLQYEKKNIKKTTTCCHDLPIKCWRHYVKGVEMHNLTDPDDKEGLVEYFKEECRVAGNYLNNIEFLENLIP